MTPLAIESIAFGVLEKTLKKVWDDAYSAPPIYIGVPIKTFHRAHRLLGGDVHYTQTKRWRYLVKRGARK